MKILAIESSCDETSAAVIDGNDHPSLLSNVVSTQIDIHKEYGGVVPEVAARAHIENILPVINKALADADLELFNIDYIAVTYGPGLVGSLAVGIETAKGLALAQNLPLVPINHLEGHIYANFLEAKPEFPLITLIASGGHSSLVYVKSHLEYKVIGSTRDDAAGEAFDKAAKLLGLGYPGGPIISKLANEGDDKKYQFPLVDLTQKSQRDQDGFLIKSKPSLDFSFSGLKTALLNRVRNRELEGKKLTPQEVKDLAASFEKGVVDNLLQNSIRAIEQYRPKTFILSGGVAANRRLRDALADVMRSHKIDFFVPDFKYCTDNAAMIGAAAFYRIKKGKIKKGPFGPEPSLTL